MTPVIGLDDVLNFYEYERCVTSTAGG